jgi:tetratricopeptide (TPR) repeat protein
MKNIILMIILCSISCTALAAQDIGSIKEELRSSDAEVRSDACLALIDEGRTAIPLLAPLLHDRSMLVRHCTAYALSRLGGTEVEKLFKDGLKATSPDLRRISALGIGMLGQADLEGLLPLLKDKSWEVRWSAAFALGRCGDRRALPDLGQVSRNDGYYDSKSGTYPVRQAALKAIDRLNAVIGWRTDLKRALSLSRSDGRPLLIYFRKSGSDLCGKFERKIFTEEKIIDAAQRFIPVWLDHQSSPGAFTRYGIKRVPVILFIAPDGSRLGEINGTISPEDLLEKMLAGLEREKSASRLRARLKVSPGNLETAWQLAGCYMDDGQWDRAGEMLNLIIKNDPDNRSSLKDNALFARAYIQGKLGDYQIACRELKELCGKYSAFGDRAEAMYCWGISAVKAGNNKEAEEVLDQLRKEYPESNFAGIAGDILNRLRTGEGKL